VSEILYRHDPVGVAGAGAPEDEYEPEVGTILPKLQRAKSVEDVRRVVHAEFVSWFDEVTAGREEAYSDIAKEIWELLK
jgi:hypothetical protein